MIIVECEDVELDACPDCQGLWFDAQEIQQLFEHAGVPAHAYDFEAFLEKVPRGQHPSRKCPRCRRRIMPVRAPSREGELILDECPRGHGLWFDKGELGALVQGLVGEDCESLERIRAYLGHFAFVDEPKGDGPEAASEKEGGDAS
jgi:Zn-finger nucleic acid-binding protein